MQYLLYLDLTPDLPERRNPRTWWGVALTLAAAAVVLATGSYFLSLYFTESVTRFENETTIAKTYSVRFRCVSIGGCNITYRYDPAGRCGHLATLPDRNVSAGQDFIIEVCRSQDAKEGVLVRTIFDFTQMWLVDNIMWSVELYQNGRYIPVGKVTNAEIHVERLRNTATVDRTAGGRITSSLWTVEASDTILFDDYCYQRNDPYPFICGSLQFTLADLFVREVKQGANTLRADVFAPTFALVSVVTGALTFITCLVRQRSDNEDKIAHV